MHVMFDDDCVLHIVPETRTESMALKYWAKEYAAHGDRVLEVDTDIPGKRKTEDDD